MRKNNKKNNDISSVVYTCSWCGTEKKQSPKTNNFNKQAILNGVHICNDCIANKYNQLAEQVGRDRAILMCCAILNIPVNITGIRRLTADDDFLSYIRKCNLLQNKTPYTNFIDSLIDLPIVFNTDSDNEKVCLSLDKIGSDLKDISEKIIKIRNTLKK